MHKTHFIDVPHWQSSNVSKDKSIENYLSKRLIWPLIPYLNSNNKTLTSLIEEKIIKQYFKHWKENKWPYDVSINLKNTMIAEDDFAIDDFQFIKEGNKYTIRYLGRIYSEQCSHISSFNQFLQKLKFLITSFRILGKNIGVSGIWIRSSDSLSSTNDYESYRNHNLSVKENSKIDLKKEDIEQIICLYKLLIKLPEIERLIDNYNIIFNTTNDKMIVKIYTCLELIFKNSTDYDKKKTIPAEKLGEFFVKHKGTVYYISRIRNLIIDDGYDFIDAVTEVEKIFIKKDKKYELDCEDKKILGDNDFTLNDIQNPIKLLLILSCYIKKFVEK